MKKFTNRTKNSGAKEIFSTGVFLESVECIINGQKQWRWIANRFEDDSFLNGSTIIPLEYANKAEKLIKSE